VTLDLDAAMLADGPLHPGERIDVRAPDGRFEAIWARTFADVGAGDMLLFQDSSGALALAVSGGSAPGLMDLAPNRQVPLRPPKCPDSAPLPAIAGAPTPPTSGPRTWPSPVRRGASWSRRTSNRLAAAAAGTTGSPRRAPVSSTRLSSGHSRPPTRRCFPSPFRWRAARRQSRSPRCAAR